jgi:hypothetical protein
MPNVIEQSLKLAAELRTDVADLGFIKDISSLGQEWGGLGHPPVTISGFDLAPDARERLEAILRIFNIGVEAGKERQARRCRR